jgi:hypothetical protein
MERPQNTKIIGHSLQIVSQLTFSRPRLLKRKSPPKAIRRTPQKRVLNLITTSA